MKIGYARVSALLIFDGKPGGDTCFNVNPTC
jgi:hypothetical protein